MKPVMKVAFDVQGTLEDGHYVPQTIRLFRAFAELECEMHVWSFGGRNMARDCVEENLLSMYGKVDPVSGRRRVHAMSKRSRDYPGAESYMDLCVDDDPGTAPGLDSLTVVYVHEIPTDEAELVAFAKRLHDAFLQRSQG